jgi:hypothetical protein
LNHLFSYFSEQNFRISQLVADTTTKSQVLNEISQKNEELRANEIEKLMKIKQRTEYLLSYQRALEAQLDKFGC